MVAFFRLITIFGVYRRTMSFTSTRWVISNLSYGLVILFYLMGTCGWGMDILESWQNGKLWETKRGQSWYGERASNLDSNSQRISAQNNVTFCSIKFGEILLQWKKKNSAKGEAGTTEEQLHKVECTIYNRGDDGDKDEKEFYELFTSCQRMLGERLKTKKKRSFASQNAAKIKTEAWRWESPQGTVVLVAGFSIEGHKAKRMEYIRLLLLRDRHAIRDGDPSDKTTSHLRDSVACDSDGTVWIKGIPMVDQGSKGYCVPASVARMFAYYGMTSVDMHTLAAICNSDSSDGTSLHSMQNALKKISGHFNTTLKTVAEYWHKRGEQLEKYDKYAKKRKLPPRKCQDPWIMEVDPKAWSDFCASNKMNVQGWLQKIRTYIDRGIPILWSVAASQMYCHEDTSIRGGAHMRLIIGYNVKLGTIIFSDSWGEWATKRVMNINNAYAITDCIYVLCPW